MKHKIASGCGKYTVSMEPVECLQCNNCRLRLEPDTPDTPEFHDALHWEDTGGYGSIFGDGTKVSLTLCGPCLDKIAGHLMIKEYDD